MPEENVSMAVVPVDVLQSLMQEAHSLKKEVQALKTMIDSQGERIADLEATQETHADNQMIQLRLIG